MPLLLCCCQSRKETQGPWGVPKGIIFQPSRQLHPSNERSPTSSERRCFRTKVENEDTFQRITVLSTQTTVSTKTGIQKRNEKNTTLEITPQPSKRRVSIVLLPSSKLPLSSSSASSSSASLLVSSKVLILLTKHNWMSKNDDDNDRKHYIINLLDQSSGNIEARCKPDQNNILIQLTVEVAVLSSYHRRCQCCRRRLSSSASIASSFVLTCGEGDIIVSS